MSNNDLHLSDYMASRKPREPVAVRFIKLDPRATLPSYAKAGDAAMDVYALEECTLGLNDPPMKVRTGIASEIPEGYFASARNRSGLSAKGIHLGGGVIDAGYRGEWFGILHNLSQYPYIIKPGDRIFQVIIQKFERAEIVEVAALSSSDRGAGGFGSTGR